MKTKSILFLASTLMFIAFVWGFVDYVKADSNSNFRTLYTPKQKTKILQDTIKEINTEYFSRSPLPYKEENTQNKKQSKSILKKNNENIDNFNDVKEINEKVENKKTNKVSFKSFSRAPLERVIKIDELKDSSFFNIDSIMVDK